MSTRDVNNTELFDADPRLLVIDADPRLSFSGKNEPKLSRDSSQASPSRAETLTKRARAELRLWVTETETASCFRFEHHLHH